MKRENQRRSIIRDLNLGKTTSREGYNAYMKEYMARLRAQQRSIKPPSEVLFQRGNPCPSKRRRK